MSMNRSPIVGVFDERARAEQAIEELYNAGIHSDRIVYSGESTSGMGGGLLDSLKSLFTGTGGGRRSSDVVNDLTNIGLTQDEAQYYAQEYEAGRTIVAVQPGEQEDNALNILRTNGAYDFRSRSNFQKGDAYASQSGYNPAGMDRTSDTIAPDTATQGNTQGNYPPGRQDTARQGDAAPTYSEGTTSSPYSNTSVNNPNYQQPGSNYDPTNAGTYPQQPGYSNNPNARNYQQQSGYSNDPNARNYQQQSGYSNDPNARNYQQSGYSNDPNMDPQYQRPADMQSASSQQGFTQVPNQQDYTTPGNYQQPDAYNQGATSSSSDQTDSDQRDYNESLDMPKTDANTVMQPPAGPGSGVNRGPGNNINTNPDNYSDANTNYASGAQGTQGAGNDLNRGTDTNLNNSGVAYDHDIINNDNRDINANRETRRQEKEAHRREEKGMDPYPDRDPNNDINRGF